MKIILLGRYKSGGIFSGPEKVASRLFDAFSEKGDDVTFIEYYFDGSRYSIFQKLFGSETVLLQGASSVRRMGIVPFLIFLLGNAHAVIHIVTFERFAAAAFWLKRILGLRIVFTVHGVVQHENKYFRPYASPSLKLKDAYAERVCMEHSDVVFFLSEDSRKLAAGYYRFAEPRTRIIANGIDGIFSTSWRAHPAGSGEIASLVFVGDAARPEKGLAFLLQSLQLVKQKYKLLIVGKNDPQFLDPLSSLPHEFVQKMGTDQFAAWLSDKDVFISPSSCDQFGIAAAEAMASGLAVIATRETGMSRYINSGANGLLTNYGSVAELSSAIDRLCADHDFIARLGTAGAETVKTLTWQNIAEAYRLAYRTEAQ